MVEMSKDESVDESDNNEDGDSEEIGDDNA